MSIGLVRHYTPLVKKRLTRLLKTACFSAVLVAGKSEGQTFLPDDYFSRFGNIDVVASTELGFGVRYFPLPISQDIRLTLVKTPTYWDYGISYSGNSADIKLGVFYSSPQFRIDYYPAAGLQFLGHVQPNYGNFNSGYAFKIFNDRTRVKALLGLAFQEDAAEAYGFVSTDTSFHPKIEKLHTLVNVVSNTYYFPQSSKSMASIGIYVAADRDVAPQLNISATHYEKFVFGTLPISALQEVRTEVSTATIRYRFRETGGFISPGGLRFNVIRDWANHSVTGSSDFLIRIQGLPALIGPSVGRRWYDDGTVMWIFSLTSM